MKKWILLSVTLAIICGCSQPTEEQRVAKQRSSFKYRSYRFASEQATTTALNEYNKRASDKVTSFKEGFSGDRGRA